MINVRVLALLTSHSHKGNSGVNLHTPTKFHLIQTKDVRGVGGQTNRQTLLKL